MYYRHSIRLSNYDYSYPGLYKEYMFGEIIDNKMVLNDVGKMINKWWLELKNKYNHVDLDKYVIMPNHVHGIVCVGADLCVCPIKKNVENKFVDNNGRPHRVAPTLGYMVNWFKTMTTNEYIRNVKYNNWPPFDKRLWQRNYYEHIIRNEESLYKIREYIINNPINWVGDEDYKQTK